MCVEGDGAGGGGWLEWKKVHNAAVDCVGCLNGWFVGSWNSKSSSGGGGAAGSKNGSKIGQKVAAKTFRA